VIAIIVLGLLALVAALLDPPPPPVSGTARASDGDSFRLGDDRVRLLGLDAPELSQLCAAPDGGQWSCGRVARDRMAALLATGPVACRPEDKDRYNRLLARCTVAGNDLGALMVAEGLAVSSGDYWQQEQAARAGKRGIWAGGFDRPADWRDDHPRPQGILGWLGL
jgi:endonuclease YncB( thermonuclease family)